MKQLTLSKTLERDKIRFTVINIVDKLRFVETSCACRGNRLHYFAVE